MNRVRAPRPLLWLALLGWLAQLCLPLAHAAAMAEQGVGLAGWCGQDSPALQAKLSELPAEIRDILKDSLGHAPHAADLCVDLCVTPPGAALPPLPVTVALRAAGVETRVPESAPPLRVIERPTPPARGPPSSA